MVGTQEALAAAEKSGPLYLGTIGILRLVSLRNQLRARERWSREQILKYQQTRLKQLRQYAYSKSPFYRRFHQGLFDAPLEKLPVLTKAELMKNWDDIVTDRRVKLKEVQEFIAKDDWSKRFKNKYYINMTSGTTGFRGIFIYDSGEWREGLGSGVRALDWRGLSASATQKHKHAYVTTIHPWHQTALMGASTKGRFAPTLQIDSTEPLDDVVAKLNAFQPEMLSIYGSMAKALARRQMEGRLKISPRIIDNMAEPLTEDIREAILRAWEVQPFDGYGCTECQGIALDCGEHKGLHVLEDRVIAEFVDENNQPVPSGQYSAKVLITVLFNHTIPLIRYELQDSVCLAEGLCPCGRPFLLIKSIQGRITEVIYLGGRSGEMVAVQPLFFHLVMEKVPAEGWQIIQEGRDRIQVSVLNPEAAFDEKALKNSLVDGLAEMGIGEVSVEIDYPSALRRNSIGKVTMIKAMESQVAVTSSMHPS